MKQLGIIRNYYEWGRLDSVDIKGKLKLEH